ncbi:ANTAR domain-containing protein [Streptomyces sp. 5112.2]|uniref:ANTAR domain-containing protein n=1 Tax=unclassified Streptomyces TaxID=2593676 RepID=UPI0027D82C54|nr:ANTAR domain-containing protein [Streptomyces sp. 5112.2]
MPGKQDSWPPTSWRCGCAAGSSAPSPCSTPPPGPSAPKTSLSPRPWPTSRRSRSSSNAPCPTPKPNATSSNTPSNRIVIEQVKGVLAERWHLGVDEAFGTLRAYARAHNLKPSQPARNIPAGTFDTRQIRATPTPPSRAKPGA